MEEEDILLSGDDDFVEHLTIVADKKQSPIRIDKFLMDRLERTSRNRLQDAIRSGAVKVNGEEVKPNFKIKPLHRIDITLPKSKYSGELLPENIPLDIVYEDDDVLVINKVSGMVVHPGHGNYSGTLVNALVYHFKDLPLLPGNLYDRPGLVHRIDKDTSGLLVVAKNEYAMTHLAKQFFDHTTFRRYVALVWGEPQPQEATITGFLGRNPSNRMQYLNFEEEDKGKYAITHYKLLESLFYVSLVECRLETGRTHQIRVHMKHIGHTLFNDERYEGNKILKGTVYSKYKQFVDNCFALLPRTALHARNLGFVHPTTGEKMLFEAPIPADFQSCLTKWREYIEYVKK